MAIRIPEGVDVPVEVLGTLRNYTCYRCGQKYLSVVQAIQSVRGLTRERWVVDTECVWCGLTSRYFTTKVVRPDEPTWWSLIN